MKSEALILVVDDNNCNIQTLRDYLRFKGYRVEIARNGLEAIEKTAKYMPDLILMDIQMPLLDGLKTIRWLKAQERFRDIPIVALTALALSGDRERCLQAGANGYLSKPISLRQLTARINGWLANPPSPPSLCSRLLGQAQ